MDAFLREPIVVSNLVKEWLITPGTPKPPSHMICNKPSGEPSAAYKWRRQVKTYCICNSDAQNDTGDSRVHDQLFDAIYYFETRPLRRILCTHTLCYSESLRITAKEQFLEWQFLTVLASFDVSGIKSLLKIIW